MSYIFRRLAWLFPLITIVGLEGCVYEIGPYSAIGHYSSTPYQPSADGPAAVVGATAIIPNLHLAYAGEETVAPGAFGPGVARFNGTLLEAYSADGNLDPTPTASSQPGFFLRPPNSYSSGGRSISTFGGSGGIASVIGEGDNDALIAWGRWFGFSNTPLTLITRGNLVIDDFHYAIAQLTPNSGLPQQSGLARYSLLGATQSATGRAAYLVLSSTSALSVLWGSAPVKIGLDLMWVDGYFDPSEHPLLTPFYQMRTTDGVDNPASSQLSLRPGTATFGGPIATFPVCGPQGSTCSGSVEGFFAGPGAERAGLSYRVVGSAPNQPDGVLSGVAAFAFSEFVTPLAPPPPPGPVVLSSPAATTIAYAMNDFGMDIVGSGAATQAADAQLNGYSLTSSPTFFAPQRGTATTAEGGGDSLITWGRWTGGTFTGPLSFLPDADARRTFNANQGLHYVVGAETPIGGLPLTGTATFNLLGATSPTWGDGAFAPGTFTGSMAVQWGGATSTMVGANFSVAMPGDTTYNIVTTGGLANPAASEIAIVAGTARFSGFVQAANPGGRAACSAFCDVSVRGFFAGPAAERAGIAYSVGIPGSNSISGAAAFTKQ